MSEAIVKCSVSHSLLQYVCIQEDYWRLCINSVPRYFSESIYQMSEFSAGVFGASNVQKHTICKRDALTFFPFLRVTLYLSLICLIALAKTLIAVLNTRRESRSSCLVTNSRRDALIFFSPFSKMLSIGFLYVAFIML